MKILILGGDGYLGWSTAMYLSQKGHQVCVVDNYLRRDMCREQNVEPLIQPPNLHERVKIWKSVSLKDIDVRIGDCCDYSFLSKIFEQFRPDAVVHYAEQPSAPYSMKGHKEAYLTLQNNLMATLNCIYAVIEHVPECHIVKLGTMGEYGTPNIDIEEGWIDIEHNGRKDKFLFPRAAGSLYHTTKVQDTDMIWFYVRMNGISVTDLMQGPVYGVHTDETRLDKRLMPIFNYDDLFGTVVNRFLVQAVHGFPLTVYGKGRQTRGYLNLMDTLQCVELSILNPAKKGELRIFNQLTETFTVLELAEVVQKAGKELGLNVEVKSIPNPRKEAEEHYYNPKYTGLKELGLKPHLLTPAVAKEMLEVILENKDKIDERLFMPRVKWK